MRISKGVGRLRIVSVERDYHALFEDFWPIYQRRPIKSNDGGMKLPHMFATFVLLREDSPEVVIESGVWRGQSTWLIEQALPEARIVSIDLDLSRREYVSSRAEYYDIDFGYLNFSDVPPAGRRLSSTIT